MVGKSCVPEKPLIKLYPTNVPGMRHFLIWRKDIEHVAKGVFQKEYR